jgi:hypothetical protein
MYRLWATIKPTFRVDSVVERHKGLHVRKVLHPPYSSDIVPLDSFLFRYLKEKMLGLEFDSAEDVLH